MHLKTPPESYFLQWNVHPAGLHGRNLQRAKPQVGLLIARCDYRFVSLHLKTADKSIFRTALLLPLSTCLNRLKHTHTREYAYNQSKTERSCFSSTAPFFLPAILLFSINANYLILSSMQIRSNEGRGDCPSSSHLPVKLAQWQRRLPIGTILYLTLSSSPIKRVKWNGFFFCLCSKQLKLQ